MTEERPTYFATMPIECEFCHEVFTGSDNAERFQVHWDKQHQEPVCPVCGRAFTGKNPKFALGRHLWNAHRMKGDQATGETRWAEPAQQGSPGSGGKPDPTTTPEDIPRSTLDELAALEVRVAYLENQYQRLYEMFNIHQRRQDSHQNPQVVLGVH